MRLKKRANSIIYPARGEPLPGVDGQYSEDWWLKDKIRREKLDVTPATLISRRRVEDWMETYLTLPSIAQLRTQADHLNEAIEKANQTDLGPLLPQPLIDIDARVSLSGQHTKSDVNKRTNGCWNIMSSAKDERDQCVT